MLKNKSLESKLLVDGFVKFPFLDSRALLPLYDLYAEFEHAHSFKGKYHHSTFHIGDRAISEAVDMGIKAVIAPIIEEHFSDYELFVGNFMIKEPGKDSEVQPHQDWTYVDEPQYMSLNLWIPLQDVEETNGCMTFLPRSHSICQTLRTSPHYPGLFDQVMDLAKSNMVAVPMKAGEAVLFSHATLHGSTVNKSNSRRLNVVQGIYSKHAQLHHFFINENANPQIKQYDISINDFYNLQDLQRPEYIKSVNEFNFDFPVLNQDDFLKIYPKTGLLKKIKTIIYGG